MEECLQYAAADGGGLVGGSKAVGLLAPWVDVAAFHALVDLQAALEQAPETAGEGAAHGFAVYRGGNFSLLNQLSDLHARLKNAVRRGPGRFRRKRILALEYPATVWSRSTMTGRSSG